jgi:multiple sugar transport system substrate-binding protein
MTNMRRSLALLAVAGLGSLAACGGGSDKSAATGPVTITFWTGQTDEAAQLIQKLADEYHGLHPDVTISVEEGAIPDEMRSKLELTLGTNTYPDVAYVYGSDAAALSRSDKVVDLTEAVKDPAVGWDDFWPSERTAATIDGKVVAFPAVVGDLGIIYNKRMFAAAGVAEPTADWTWEDFRTIAKQLTNADDSAFGTAYNTSGTEGTVATFLPMVWQQGLDVTAADGKTVGFDSPAIAASLELLRAMAIDDKSVLIDPAGDQAQSLFTNDKVAMLITGPWALSDLQAAKAEFGVQVLPGYDGHHDTTGGQDLWMLFNHDDARRAQAATDFIAWFTQAEQDARWSIDQFNLPIRAATAEQPAFTKTAAELPGYQEFFDNLGNTRARPSIVAYPEVSFALGEQIAAVLTGQSQPDAALKSAVAAGNAALAESAGG